MLVRLFNKKKYGELDPLDNNSYRVSSYLPQGMKKVLQSKINNGELQYTDYIIGPLYKKNDYQIGVTGGVKYNEPSAKAITRELGEEIGLVPMKLEYLKTEKVETTGNKTLTVYSLKFEDTTFILDHQHDLEIYNGTDNRKKQVGCLVYGTEKYIKSFFSKEHIYLYKSEDTIKGIVAISIKDIYEFGQQGRFKNKK